MHLYTTAPISHMLFQEKQVSIRHPDQNIKQVASNRLRKIKSKQKLSLQQFPLKVPESLSTSPSIKWSPDCFKAVQHINESKKDNPTKQNMVGIRERGKLVSKD